MKGRGNVKHIERTVSARHCVLSGNLFCNPVHLVPFHWRNNNPTSSDIRLQGIQHPLRFLPGKTLGAILGKAKCLQTCRLSKFKNYKRRNMNGVCIAPH